MPRRSQGGTYPDDWRKIAQRVKSEIGWRCARCGDEHNPPESVLTVHHMDLHPTNNDWWNLLPLCSRCHLSIQGRVILERPWIFSHSPWFQPYVAGYYAKKYLGLDLTADQTIARLDELLALESQAVLGTDPIGLEYPT